MRLMRPPWPPARPAAAMGLATADLLYLHNPAESQLALVGRQEFMRVSGLSMGSAWLSMSSAWLSVGRAAAVQSCAAEAQPTRCIASRPRRHQLYQQRLPLPPARLQRLRSAFEWAERARAAGQIIAYGIASWSCFRRVHLSC